MDNRKQEIGKLHEYVHGGLLHRNEGDERNKNKHVATYKIQQKVQETWNDKEEDISTQEYELVIEDHHDTKQQLEEESTDEGEQNQEDIDTQDYNHVHDSKYSNDLEERGKYNKRGLDDNGEQNYPGVSSQKRVKNRAEQIVQETQAQKKEQQAEVEQTKERNKTKEQARQNQRKTNEVETDKEQTGNKEKFRLT
eukprot:7660141-Heterocapsa_arctica.AAC.1